jgi:hypothetical protein
MPVNKTRIDSAMDRVRNLLREELGDDWLKQMPEDDDAFIEFLEKATHNNPKLEEAFAHLGIEVSIAEVIAADEAPTCCLCNGPVEPWRHPETGELLGGYGHNPAPLGGPGDRCCNNCQQTKVLPAR